MKITIGVKTHEASATRENEVKQSAVISLMNNKNPCSTFIGLRGFIVQAVKKLLLH